MGWRESTREAFLMDLRAMEEFNGVRSIIGGLTIGSYALFPENRLVEAKDRIDEFHARRKSEFKITPAGAGLRVTRTG